MNDGTKSRSEERTRKRGEVPDQLELAGGMVPGSAAIVAAATGDSEAHAYGVASFYSLLARPEKKLRVCTGLSCRLRGADEVLSAAREAGLDAEGYSCLAACDAAPAVLKGRETLPEVTPEDMARTGGDWQQLVSSSPRMQTVEGAPNWFGDVGSYDGPLVFDLPAGESEDTSALAAAAELGTPGVLDAIEASGLQGRGGAGFPAHIKWRAVAGMPAAPHFVVLNADESEPGTFKDREVMMRRPDLVVIGLAIAARAVGATEIYLYLRGEFTIPRRRIEATLARLSAAGHLDGLDFHIHEGQGAYICGEETALLEALEGKRGMPRLKPPFPVEHGLWGKPTLIHNVETIAAVPFIVLNGGAAFRDLGRGEPGTKLYSISGHVGRPGVYETPLGVSLDELVELAGGYTGTLKAFSPGGASSGFLPASERTRPMDYKHLADVGSMLGSSGVVVLDDTVDLRWSALEQLRFFEDESCGQCAPCRIGTRYLRDAVDRDIAGTRLSNGEAPLTHVDDAAWQMVEGSICGLGQIAALPLTSARQHFPADFPSDTPPKDSASPSEPEATK
ncbi:MAG: NADH-ubiquinone oxidoreductase-F iron-sulfur binding region domain-containing protein [Planctomycetota bacterium]|nr:NADH-ubiquinone oxidoreductase-F iron-sulfur binding region domain-containing protein [Planctomycetota bacterium]